MNVTARHSRPNQGLWTRWLREPRNVGLRKAVFQVHLWSGVILGLYVFFISVTGSVLVYRNELYEAAMPTSGTGAADGSLTAFRMVSTLIELHDELLSGETGQTLNGIGALGVLLMILTGLVIWWPGVMRWRRALLLRSNVGWKRWVWDLHGMCGIWTFAATFVFAFSGLYLCFPETFHTLADRIEPPTTENAANRLVDDLLYWLAFLHFGRINGIGLFCAGPGLCDQTIKAVWALFGLSPAVMFVTGAIMWWNRVLRRWWRQTAGRA